MAIPMYTHSVAVFKQTPTALKTMLAQADTHLAGDDLHAAVRCGANECQRLVWVESPLDPDNAKLRA